MEFLSELIYFHISFIFFPRKLRFSFEWETMDFYAEGVGEKWKEEGREDGGRKVKSGEKERKIYEYICNTF